jgi:hypothetical protein
MTRELTGLKAPQRTNFVRREGDDQEGKSFQRLFLVITLTAVNSLAIILTK